jgi:hypothetical protein
MGVLAHSHYKTVGAGAVFPRSRCLLKACTIVDQIKPRFIEIPREKRSSLPFTEEQLTAIRGGVSEDGPVANPNY